MTPTFFALLVCAGGLFVSGTGALYLVMVFSLFGAAAAIALPALGNATITPAVLFLPFLLARALRERGLGECLRPLAFPNAGFWLMLVALWGVISAYFLPRIFEGEFLIRQYDRFVSTKHHMMLVDTRLVALHPIRRTAARVPDPTHEAIRNLTQARQAAMEDFRPKRQLVV